MAMRIMIQGTMSNAGKSLIAAGLCRIFRQDGYRVAPFKSQNMALNSFITKEGLEMGRAQVMQAEAAGMEPTVAMNPILLKPTNDIGSQVIVNGEVIGNMSARDYFAYKKKLVPDILAAYHRLEEQADIIVIEGAGSPAEINLKENDIVNMGLAELLNAPVLIAGDIDRGGVFAQLLGTQLLLEESERRRVKGFIINKFRGDVSILTPGIRMLEEQDVDVMIVGRGGGSIEDLWAFNEEEVARAIFACNTPVISAVGHQTDTTISDYVADLRAPTPSAAAELAVFDVQLVEKWLMDYGTQMRRQLELKLNQMRTRLMHDEEKLRYLNPRTKLKENEKRLDELGAALERRMQAILEQKRHKLALLSGSLDGMSPLKKLAQGYSYVEDAGGHALTDAGTVQIGEALSIHLYRGSLKAAVTEICRQDVAADGSEKGRIDG